MAAYPADRIPRPFGISKFSSQWMAAMCSHIPNRGEYMAKYYGRCSNVSREKRQKNGGDDVIPCIIEPEGGVKAIRRNWVRPI